MSCSVQIKTRNPVKTKKVNNVIHRTTSETIRLGEPDVLLSTSSRQVMVISPPPSKKSTCSFQITGVSVAQRTDVGDDSADDLDESHTDDISRVTDNETPSFSEDTCSRDAEENYVGSCSALCSVTVIATSSQYGLAIMPLDSSIGTVSENSDLSSTKASEETTTGTQSSPTVEAAVTTSGRFPGTRFKIVKVETSKPFRRGRWSCMDYLDQSPYTPKNALTYKSPVSPGNYSQLQYTMTATTTQAQPVQVNADSGTNRANPNTVAQLQSTEATTVTQSTSAIALSKMYEQPIGLPSQSQIYGVAQTSPNPSIIQQNPAVAMQLPSNQIYANVQHNSMYAVPIQDGQTYIPTQQMQTYSPVHITQPSQTVTLQNLSQPQVSTQIKTQDNQLTLNISIQNPVQHIPVGGAITSTPNYTILRPGAMQLCDNMFVTASQPQQTSVEPRPHPVLLHQPISLQFEPNQQFQILHTPQALINVPQALINVPQAPIQAYPVLARAQTISDQSYYSKVPCIPSENPTELEQTSQFLQMNINDVPQANHNYGGEFILQQINNEEGQTRPFQWLQPNDMRQSECILNNAVVDETLSSSVSKSSAAAAEMHSTGTMLSIIPSIPNKETDCASPDSVIEVSSLLTSKPSTMNSAASSGILTSSTGATQVNSVASQTGSTPTATGVVFAGTGTIAPTASAPAAEFVAPTSTAPSATFATSGVPALPNVPTQCSVVDDISVAKVTEAISVIVAAVEVPHADAANNTSAIIDTKIEQAMDLVKSHLMYTVREEVEVLKERISVLLERINQLEMENNFLKANATPEVLTALNNRAPGAQAQGINPSTTGADGGAPSN